MSVLVCPRCDRKMGRDHRCSRITRRHLFFGLLGGAVAAVMKPAAAHFETVTFCPSPWGFKPRDDTALLQGIIDEATVTGKPLRLVGHKYYISKTITFHRLPAGSDIEDCFFQMTRPGVTLFEFAEGARVEGKGAP